MKHILLLSVAVNTALAAALYKAYKRIRTLGPSTLPKEKPDFTRVETELRTQLQDPLFDRLVTLQSFESGVWLCQATLIHKVPKINEEWHLLVELVQRVSKAMAIPGRVAGTHHDTSSPPRVIGSIFEFGYSPEVGYAHPNEFF